jgi:hypothetical protein
MTILGTLDLTNNWWGQASQPYIENRIWDQLDDATRASTNIVPFLLEGNKINK